MIGGSRRPASRVSAEDRISVTWLLIEPLGLRHLAHASKSTPTASRSTASCARMTPCSIVSLVAASLSALTVAAWYVGAAARSSVHGATAPAAKPARTSSHEHQAADLRRRERRGVFLGGRHAADLSVDARRLSLRPDLHDEDRRHATSGGSAPAPGGRRAGTTIRAGSRSCLRRRTRRRRRVRRSRATRAATSGRSTPATTSIAPSRTART